MIAVIAAGGKQHIVHEGDQFKIELLEDEAGKTLTFDALLVGEEDGSKVQVGTPTVPGAKVTATIVEHGRSEKVSIIKYKAKSRYRRHTGHRQPYTMIRIEKISA